MAETVHYVLVVVGVSVFFIGLLLGISLKKLESYEVGLSYNPVTYKLGNAIQKEGLHAGPPGYQFITFPVVYRTFTNPMLECMNSDGVYTELDISYQYKANESRLLEIVKLFRDYDKYKEILEIVGESAIHRICSHYDTVSVVQKRPQFAQNLTNVLQELYQAFYADVTGVQVNNIKRPDKYNQALQEKEAARENIRVKIGERPNMLTEANTEKAKALGEATIILEKAVVDARIIITRSLADSQAVLSELQSESSVYSTLVKAGFTGKSLISYIEVETIATTEQPLHVGFKSPVVQATP